MKISFYISLGVFLTALFLLVTGSSVLTISLNQSNTLPLGTLITAFGLIAFPSTIFFGSKRLSNPQTKFLKWLSKAIQLAIVLTLFWIPFSYFLSGNWAFNFSAQTTFQGSDEAMILFWRISYALVIIPLSILIIYWISLAFEKFQSKN